MLDLILITECLYVQMVGKFCGVQIFVEFVGLLIHKKLPSFNCKYFSANYKYIDL